jgi:hypothetical protein
MHKSPLEIFQTLTKPNPAVEVSCRVFPESNLAPFEPDAIFFVTAEILQQKLEGAHHVGDAQHPNKLELETQRALVRHAAQHGVGIRLNDDIWRRTSYALIDLFEEGSARMLVDGKRFGFSDVVREEWSDGSQRGGFLYKNVGGSVIFKRETWRS